MSKKEILTSPIGRPIRVGVFEHDPDAFKCFRVIPKKKCPKPGAEMEIVRMVMEILKWDWEVVDTEKTYDVMNDFGNLKKDGNFSGMMGLLAEDKIDMGGLSMRITPERMKAAHFTFPIRYFQNLTIGNYDSRSKYKTRIRLPDGKPYPTLTKSNPSPLVEQEEFKDMDMLQQVYIIATPPERDFRNFIFDTFTTRIWILLAVTIVGVSLFRFFIGVFFEKRKGTKSDIFGVSFLETYAVVVRQTIPNPTAVSLMLIEGMFMFLMLVVYTYYQSSMNSKLTASPKTAVPFYHQSELIELFAKKRRYPTYYFDFLLEGSTKENQERINQVLKYNPVVTHATENAIIAEMKRGGVFYSTYDIEFTPQPVSSWDRKNGLTVIRDTTGILSYVAFGFSKGNKKLCELFNKGLLQILPGVPQITTAPGYAHKKDPEDTSIQAKKTTLSLTRHLEQLFEIYGIGMALCIGLFISEFIFYQLERQRKEKKYSVTSRNSTASELHLTGTAGNVDYGSLNRQNFI